MSTNSNFLVKGNFWVDSNAFYTFFEGMQKGNAGLFPHKLNVAGYEKWANNIAKWSGRTELSLNEFIGVFCIVYNETGGRFESISEQGSKEYIESANASGKVGYAYKERGRGYIQVTFASSYRIVLGQLGYDYDALSSEEIDKLFFDNDKVAFGALNIWFNDARFAKKTFDRLKLGEFAPFGKAISGSSAYGQIFENRCMYLLKSLSGKKLENSLLLKNKNKIIDTVVVGTLLGVGFFLLIS